MARREHASVSESGMRISNIADAGLRRSRSGEIADWVVSNISWTVAVTDSADFHDRWPLLSRIELAAVEEELHRRAKALEAPDADFDAIASTLTGRPTYWTAAADWLTLNPRGSISDPEFLRLFSQLSRAELILAAIEHKRRVLATRCERTTKRADA